MPATTLFSQALQDLVEDAVYHGTNLVQGAFDLVCLVALGATVYAGAMDSRASAGTTVPAMEVQASVGAPALPPGDLPATCVALSDALTPLGNGCITAHVIADTFGT